MVGGERVNDKELQERRLRKKKAAERRLNALARALANVETEDGTNLVLGVYDDIQEELRAKNEALKKYKQKVTEKVIPPQRRRRVVRFVRRVFFGAIRFAHT